MGPGEKCVDASLAKSYSLHWNTAGLRASLEMTMLCLPVTLFDHFELAHKG